GADEDETQEIFTYEVIDGEAYEVDPTASSVTLSIIDAADVPVLPVVSVTTTTPELTEDEQPNLEITLSVEGEIPDDGQGVVVTFGGDGVAKLFVPRLLAEATPPVFDPADGVVPIAFTGTEVILGLLVPEVTVTAGLFDDLVEEARDVLNFEILPGDGYTVGEGTISIGIEDGSSATPGAGPTVNLSVTDADLFEGDEFTVNISVDESTGAIPDGGLELFIDSGPTDIGEFNIFGEDGIDPATDLVGIDEFPLQGDRNGGFFVTVVEPEASITLSVFEDGPGEGEEVLTFELADGELYEVANSTVDLTINDTPPGTPIVGITIEPAFVAENAEDTSTVLTFNVTNAEIPTPVFDADNNLVSGGLSVFFDGTDANPLFEEIFGGPALDGLLIGNFFDPAQPNLFELVLLQETSTVTLEIFDDVIEEESQTYSFSVLNDDAGVLGANYVVSADAGTATLTLNDGIGGPGVGPTVSLSVTDDDLAEGDEFTVNFDVDGDIPEGGLTVYVDGPALALSEFNIFGDDGID
ncbi:MAG: hypothetical protein AAF622_19715, partial [Cyanobacteria bacterium P01_C01_bin.147]